jgi:hypothetical protein
MAGIELREWPGPGRGMQVTAVWARTRTSADLPRARASALSGLRVAKSLFDAMMLGSGCSGGGRTIRVAGCRGQGYTVKETRDLHSRKRRACGVPVAAEQGRAPRGDSEYVQVVILSRHDEASESQFQFILATVVPAARGPRARLQRPPAAGTNGHSARAGPGTDAPVAQTDHANGRAGGTLP